MDKRSIERARTLLLLTRIRVAIAFPFPMKLADFLLACASAEALVL
jgi:hypothetical protein